MSNSPIQGAGRFAAHMVVSIACLAFASCQSYLPARTIYSTLGEGGAALVRAAARAGASSVVATRRADDGLRLNGVLGGRQFALIVPPHWNKQVVLFAHGYTQPGSSVAIAVDPLSDGTTRWLRGPYAEGYAVGDSAYDKSGIAVESGVMATLGLNKLAVAMGASRIYLIGVSMGGDIVVASIEKYPAAYAGAIAACGVVDGWPREIGWITGIRAAYNYFTKGTPYALPGNRSLLQSALPLPAADASGTISPVALKKQVFAIGTPILRLFGAAKAHPGGPEDRMLDNIAVIGGTEKDIAAIADPLITISLGQNDMMGVFGGEIADNSRKVYSSPYLTAAQNSQLNQSIQRVTADPAAVAEARAWYTPTRRLRTKLLAIYNVVDPLVPSDLQEPQLLQSVERTGDTANLLQRSVPAVYRDYFGTGVVGLTHCGFTAEQMQNAFDDLHHWVESGRKPTG